MAHSYVSSLLHCVWSTKQRQRLVTPELQQRLWPYIGGIANQNRMKSLAVGGVEDHVHVLLSLQLEHHRKGSYQDEFLAFLEKHQIDYHLMAGRVRRV